ncbi:MAG: 4Fe-4S dicluster domain-containing protein [Pseudomonadota bacterium]|jgi:Fe-S-cluster-containing dehydrogenase component
MARNISRRSFLKKLGAAAAAGGAAGIVRAKPALAGSSGEKVGVLVDLAKCDGCADVTVPRCVTACQNENRARYPEPKEEDVRDYWPQTKHEDWRSKRGLRTTLTPYNWTYVQKIRVEHEGTIHSLNIQRRCMHCDTPTCAAVCPFGAIEKDLKGAVSIHEVGCLGGAKCRTVCPWGIPQRQAGVGIYLKMMPKFAGGGVMYKCDHCAPRMSKGLPPACVEACRSRHGRDAPLTFGLRGDMLSLARIRAEEIGGYVYGDDENGGTGTFYVSPVPFEKIDAALKLREKERFFFPEDPNPLKSPNLWAEATLVAPVAAVSGAVLAGARALKIGGDEDDTGTDRPVMEAEKPREEPEDREAGL